MNKIIVILFVMMLIIAGCGGGVGIPDGDKLNELCQDHHGVRQVDGNSYVVVCNDGTAVSW